MTAEPRPAQLASPIEHPPVTTTTHGPLTGPVPAEVPLPNAPLVRVLAQVRFPRITSVEASEFIAPFQEAIREEYGILVPELAKTFELGPAGVVEHPPTTNAWRFHDTARKWRLTLAADFLALETMAYTSRGDFLDRLRRALAALKEHVNPAVAQRLGVRYINRVPDASRDEIVKLVRADAAGLGDMERPAAFAVVDNLFDLGDDHWLRARWGMLQPRFTLDMLTLEPLPQACWVLDLDAYVEREQEMDVDALAVQARGLAERTYRFFRWVVTDDFLRKFGGTP